MEAATVTPARLAELHRQGKLELIDVRTPVEFRAAHVVGARNVPLDRLDPAALLRDRETQGRSNAAAEPLYVICQAGGRGRQACEKLIQAGVVQVFNVEGGTAACIAAGLPIERGQQAISLERQVRIAAGSLVLIGTSLAWFVHPYFIGLAAFVGAGLLFAGLTDTCGMGLLLARMPWNQCGPKSGACCNG